MWHGGMWSGGGPWGAGGMLGLGLLWWVLVAAVVVAVVRLLGRGDRAGSGRSRRDEDDRPDSAETILRERYARGEIDKTEFDARIRDLVESRRGHAPR